VAEHVLTPRVAGGCTATLRVIHHGPARDSSEPCWTGSPAATCARRPRGSRPAAGRRSLSENPGAPLCPEPVAERIVIDPATEERRDVPATPDPTRWLTDLMSTEHVLWPSLDVADTSKAFAAAVAPWTKAVADITKMQMDMLQQMAALWLAAMPAAASTTEPIKDRRFADEAWTKDPRSEAVARTYLTQAELMQKALDAAPIDERSKAQWGFALRQVMNALARRTRW
jgi:Poly-beta-hydroxybutyrate polymerase (PhaC) N-terminus